VPSPQKEKAQFMEVYSRQVNTVYRVCYSFMKNRADTEDMVQETFLKLLSNGKVFENIGHERAWLIVTASNLCKDTLKKWWRRHEDLENFADQIPAETKEDGVLEAILELPDDYKDAVYLYYYEGYTTVEIAASLHCPESTIRSRLMRAKRKLQAILGGGEK